MSVVQEPVGRCPERGPGTHEGDSGRAFRIGRTSTSGQGQQNADQQEQKTRPHAPEFTRATSEKEKALPYDTDRRGASPLGAVPHPLLKARSTAC